MTVKKANEVIVDALEEIIVLTDEAPINPPEGRTAIRILNDMMAFLAAKGIELGYTEVSDLGDPITVPPGAIFGIKTNLAILLAPRYNVPVTQELKNNAKTGMDAMIDLAVAMIPSEYPETLPQGSGNAHPGFANQTFFPALEDTIITETGGSIGLEEDTE